MLGILQHSGHPRNHLGKHYGLPVVVIYIFKMAANSIFWKLPDKFSFFSRSLKEKVDLQAYVVEFRRLLPCDSLGFEEVCWKSDIIDILGGCYEHITKRAKCCSHRKTLFYRFLMLNFYMG